MPSSNTRPVGRILAVDDVLDNLILIKAILEGEGYEVNLATNGASALVEIEQWRPELVLLDVMMPEMDGYEVTRRVRQNTKLSYIPILLVTAHDQSSVVKGLDAGADDFVRKPFDTDELLARVRSLLRLKRSLDEQEEMSRQREDFVSRLTHDLRTPLVAADRMLNLFLDEVFCPISAEMKEAIQAMIQSNQNLLQMVNTLLEVYRHEAGQKELALAPCDLQEICRNVIQELKPLAEQKGLNLICETQSTDQNGFNSVVVGDPLELRRVLVNLISNAIKFTDAGSVKVHLFQEQKQKDQVLIVQVQDTGQGIAWEDQEIIFERFRQGRNKRADSGLGLYLSRRIIEAHHGAINVQSQPGQGSVFTVQLPLPAERSLNPEVNAPTSAAPSRQNPG